MFLATSLTLAFFTGIEWAILASLIIGAGATANQSIQQNKARKQAAQQADRQLAQQAQEASAREKAIRESKPPPPPPRTAQKFQATPRSASRSGSLRDLTVRGRVGKSALRVPRSGGGVRIPY